MSVITGTALILPVRDHEFTVISTIQKRRSSASSVDYSEEFRTCRAGRPEEKIWAFCLLDERDERPRRKEPGKVLRMDKLIIAVGLLLIIFAVWQTIQKVRGKAKSSCCGTAETKPAKKVEDTDVSHYPYHYRLSIDGMMCSNCAKNVENTLNNMKGVWGRVNLGKKEADVLAKEAVSEESFASALSDSSYTLKKYTVIEDPGIG